MGQRRWMLGQSALIASVLFLAGCKTELTTAVNYTDLLGAPTYQKGSLVIEIPGCKDPGTEFESDALLQVKSRVPAVFPKAQYLGCREESITAEALFSLPILVGARAGCGESDVCVASQTEQGNLPLVTLGTSAGFRNGLRKLKNSLHQPLEPVFRINVTNNTERAITVVVSSMRVNGKPYHYRDLKMPAGRSFDMELADVGLESALTERPALLFYEWEASEP